MQPRRVKCRPLYPVMDIANSVNCWNSLRAALPLRVERQSHGLKSVWIGKSAAKHRMGEGSTTRLRPYPQVRGNAEHPSRMKI